MNLKGGCNYHLFVTYQNSRTENHIIIHAKICVYRCDQDFRDLLYSIRLKIEKANHINIQICNWRNTLIHFGSTHSPLLFFSYYAATFVHTYLNARRILKWWERPKKWCRILNFKQKWKKLQQTKDLKIRWRSK